MLGHSGARLEFTAGGVVKTGGERERLQGLYLRCLPLGSSPQVGQILPNGYEMERLQDCDLSRGVWPLLDEVRTLLRDHYWPHPALGPPSASDYWWEEMEAWIKAQGYDWLAGLSRTIWKPSRRCLTHGDPTAANCMRRRGRLVLIDPLPPGGKIPPYAEVDMGKLLQSALGWEHVLTRGQVPPPVGCEAALLLLGFGEAFQLNSWFWCAVHCARIIPYAKEGRVRRWAARTSRKAADAVRLRS